MKNVIVFLLSLKVVTQQCYGSFDKSWLNGPLYNNNNNNKFIHQPTKYNQNEVHMRRKINVDNNDIYKASHQQISRSRIRPFDQTSGSKKSMETTKGIDIFIAGSGASKTDNLPNFGKRQDMQLIFFGTKWCGAGSIAKSKRDIGYFSLTDTCCREHDFCPESIMAKEEKFGLKNTGKFTRSHCDCDKRFYDCLKTVDSLVSNQIGTFYFNILGPQCFALDHPHSCERIVKGRCIKYGKDEKYNKDTAAKVKIYHWLDNKWY